MPEPQKDVKLEPQAQPQAQAQPLEHDQPKVRVPRQAGGAAVPPVAPALNPNKDVLFRVAFLKWKKYTKNLPDEILALPAWSDSLNIPNDPHIFRETMSCSSDKLEVVNYKDFPFLRGVRISVDPNTRQEFAEVANDTLVTHICVDIDELRKKAILHPLTTPYTGYLISAHSNLKIGMELDFSSQGEMFSIANTTSGQGSMYYNILALSDTYSFDLRTVAESKMPEFANKGDFIIYYVKVAIYGNKALPKVVKKA